MTFYRCAGNNNNIIMRGRVISVFSVAKCTLYMHRTDILFSEQIINGENAKHAVKKKKKVKREQ